MTVTIFFYGRDESKIKEKLMTHTRPKKVVMGWQVWGENVNEKI